MASDIDAEQEFPLPGTRGGKRRARILAAFHDCIITKGFAKTTLRDVAREADMSASHLLYYFPGKDTMLEHYFENVAQRIVKRIESFRTETPEQQIDLLSDLFFAGKGITRSEIGFMLECFGVAVHDKPLRRDKTKLDRFCKTFTEMVTRFGRGYELGLMLKQMLPHQPLELLKQAPVGLEMLVSGRLPILPHRIRQLGAFKKMVSRATEIDSKKAS